MEITSLFRNCGIFVVEVSSGWVFIFLNSLLFFPIFSRNAAMSDWLKKKKVLNIMTNMSCCLVVQFVVIHLCLISFCCLFLCNLSIYARSYHALGVAQIKLLTYWLMLHIWMFFHALDGCLQMVFAESCWFQFMPEQYMQIYWHRFETCSNQSVTSIHAPKPIYSLWGNRTGSADMELNPSSFESSSAEFLKTD